MLAAFRRNTSLHAALSVVLSLQLAAPCQAGLFSRWFGCDKEETKVCCTPVPVTVAMPATTTCCTNRTIVNYAPQTVYTTSWVRVPVTTYRPVATTDPTTCCRVNYMQPSTSYVWQSRRKAHVIYKPFLSRIANACDSCNTCGTGAAPATQAVIPGYPPPAAGLAVPGAVAPLVTAPGGMPSGPSAYPPSPYGAAPAYATSPAPAGAPPGVAVPGSGVTPADQRPSLDPNAPVPQFNQRPTLTYPNTSPYSSYAPPTTTAPPTSYPITPYSSTDMSVSRPPYPLNDYSTSAPAASPTPAPAPAPPRASTESSVMKRPSTPAENSNGAGATTHSNTNTNSNTNTPAPIMTPPNNGGSQGAAPNPVPDPDANTSGAPTWTAPTIRTPPVPRLLNPSDRTASLQPRMAAPVSWATVRPAVYSSNGRARGTNRRMDDIQQPGDATRGIRADQPPMVPLNIPSKPRGTIVNDPTMVPLHLP